MVKQHDEQQQFKQQFGIGQQLVGLGREITPEEKPQAEARLFIQRFIRFKSRPQKEKEIEKIGQKEDEEIDIVNNIVETDICPQLKSFTSDQSNAVSLPLLLDYHLVSTYFGSFSTFFKDSMSVALIRNKHLALFRKVFEPSLTFN